MPALIALAVAAYLAVLMFLLLRQDALIFPAREARFAVALPPGGERLKLVVPVGALAGVHLRAPARAGPCAPVMLSFAGNATNAEAAAAFLHDIFPDADVIGFHYRGYAPSDGAASAAALLEDAPLVYDVAARRAPGRPIVAVGMSIGSGVAAHLATARRLDGLILVTPFDSLERVASGHFPWVPVRLLLRHRMEPARDLAGSAVPIAVISAERDTIIPAVRTDRLRAAIGTTAYDVRIPGRGHNDVYQDPAFRTAMNGALDAIRRSRGAQSGRC